MVVQVETLSYADLIELRDAVLAEVRKRDVLTEIDAKLEALAAELHEAKGPPDGAPWVQPTTLGYPKGAITEVAGAFYRSIQGNNVWQPGAAGVYGLWERVWKLPDGTFTTKDPAAGTGPQAWRADMDVIVGQLVTHNGKTWRCKVAHRTHIGWEPSAFTYAVWDPMS